MQVSDLFQFPVKSLQGYRTRTLPLDQFGAVDDRRWMLVDTDNQFLSQRRLRRMAQLTTSITASGICIANLNGDAIEVARPSDGASTLRVWVWDDEVVARDTGDPAARWLSEQLHTQVRLVAIGAEFRRPLAAPRADRQVGFADAAPLLVIGQASLDDLNQRLAQPVSMFNFRPNLVVSGCPAFAEDNWQRMVVHTRDGPVEFECTHPCARCAIPGLDPHSGEIRKEPLRTLARFRRGTDGQIYFGMNLAPRFGNPAGHTINLGDRVDVF